MSDVPSLSSASFGATPVTGLNITSFSGSDTASRLPSRSVSSVSSYSRVKARPNGRGSRNKLWCAGLCFNCGQKCGKDGHPKRGKPCPEPKVCFTCGKQGHQSYRCGRSRSFAAKRPILEKRDEPVAHTHRIEDDNRGPLADNSISGFAASGMETREFRRSREGSEYLTETKMCLA